MASVEDSTLSPWIRKQLKKITNRLSVSELELLEMVATYKKQSLIEFVVEIIGMELVAYKKDLRFGRWLEENKVRR